PRVPTSKWRNEAASLTLLPDHSPEESRIAASGRMIALLGLLAVAGYQNRDKLGQLLGRVTGSDAAAGANAGSGAPAESRTVVGGIPGEPSRGGFFDDLGNIFGGSSRTSPPGETGIGGFLDNIGDGLRDLFDRFRGNG